MKDSKKYIIYCRVSPKGSGFEGETTVRMQEQICREFIGRIGGVIIGVYTDDLISGTSTNRPGLQEILSQVVSNRAKWDNLCVYRMDRLTRSLLDQLTICRKFAAANKGLVSATEPSFDYSTSLGKLQMAQLASINEYYRDVLADNTRNKMMQIALGGGWAPGTVPAGYKRAGRKDNRLVIDERPAARIRDIFEMYASDHYQTMDIAKKYKMNRQQILWVLRNKVYAGKIIYAGKEFEGRHEPLVSKELFEAVQRKLPCVKTGRRPKSEKRKYLLTGLIRCHCGRHMSPAGAKSNQYHYYMCTDTVKCKNRVPAEKIEQAVLRELKGYSISPEAKGSILSEIERRREAYVNQCMPEMESLESAKRQALTEREKLYHLLLDLRGSDARFLNGKIEDLTTEIETLDSQLAKYQDLKSSKTIVYKEMSKLLDSVADLVNRLKAHPKDFDLQRQLLVANVEKIQNESENAFVMSFMTSSANCQVWLPRQDSNLD